MSIPTNSQPSHVSHTSVSKENRDIYCKSMKTYITYYSEVKKNINDIGERDKSSKYFLLHFFQF